MEKIAEAAKNRADDRDRAIVQLRQNDQSLNDKSLGPEMIVFKKKLAKAESQLIRETIEKQEIIAQRDQYRLTVHKLVSFFSSYVTRLPKHYFDTRALIFTTICI